MFTNWLTYRAVAEQLDRALRNWRLGSIYSQDKNELILEVSNGTEERVLHFGAHPQSAFLIMRKDFRRAKKNTVSVMSALTGATIVSIQIAAYDRIIRITLDSGESILFTLYATKANLFVFNALGVFTESFKKSAAIPDIANDAFDDTIPVPDAHDLLDACRNAGSAPITQALKRLHPWLSGTIAEEALQRANIVSSTPSADVLEDSISDLQRSISNVLDECCTPPWHFYTENGLPVSFSLVRRENVSWNDERFEDISVALFEYYKLHARSKRLLSMKTAILRKIESELTRIDRTLGKSADEQDLRSLADTYEKYGNLLMINLERKPEQPGQMTVDDLFGGMGTVVSIPLDPRRTVIENAQRYFDKARSTRASIEYTSERKTLMEQKRERFEHEKNVFSAIGDYGALRDTMNEKKGFMQELGFTSKGEKADVFPFRRFTVAGGFEVWAGKNSENNDLLTVRNSKPNDIWFHARGVGGSHVVIKVDSAPGKPGKDTIREAAAIAAYYSKHRNAKSVPVAYTEKKYVTKPRGVPAGTVTLQREKVIMVQPGLPEGYGEE